MAIALCWHPVSEPPPFTDNPYGWPMSAPVLVYTKYGAMKIATYMHIDPDFPPQWKTHDSETWDITESVTHWKSLPMPPR